MLTPCLLASTSKYCGKKQIDNGFPLCRLLFTTIYIITWSKCVIEWLTRLRLIPRTLCLLDVNVQVLVSTVCEKPQHLGGYYGNHFDSFSSPDYPSPYPANQKCVWMIKVPLDYRIRLQFSAFEVEACSGGGQSCTCDGVVVYDGQLSVSPKLGRFCGHELPNATDSSGRYMRVELVSNSGGLESKGFTATYVSIAPDGSLFSKEDATATPSSTNGSGNKSEWRFRPPPHWFLYCR